ncbi:Hypothetical predicted protein, partial [Cloeon dipterum]
MSNGLFRSEQVGVGYMEKGVFVTGLHVTKLHPLILGGRRVVYHSMNAFKDVVTYGGVIHMSQEIPSTVNLQALPPQRKLQVGMYEVGHVNTSEGKVIHYISIDFPPGTSGSPMFTPDGKYIGPYGNGLYVSGRYCSIIPENGGDGDDEGFEDPIDPMASPDVDYKSFVPGGKVFVDWHPGAGKTRRVIVEKARLSLKDKLSTLILAPTRVVKSEIVAALHEAKFQVSEKLVSPVAGTIVVICHATWVDSMLRKVAQRDAQWNVIIMDEAHFQDPKSIAARGMMEEFRDKGSQILFLTATPPSQFGNKGSNHPIFDIDLNADQIVDDVNFIDRNREGKTVVFVSSRRQADQLARVFAGRGLRTLSLHSDNFEENYPLVKEHFSLIVTTDIAEMGANFDADTVIDLGLSTKPILDDDSVNLVTQGIVESSRIQRRGRVGRSRPGKCIAVHHDRNETIQEVCWTEARMLLDVLRGNMMPEEVDKLALMPGHFSMGAEQEKHFRQAVTTYSSPLTIWLSYYIIRSGSNVNTPQDWLFGGDRSSGLFAAVDGQVEREVKPIKYDERVFGSGGFDSLKDYLTSVTKGGLAIRRGDNYRSGGGWLNHQLSADDILAWAFSAYVIITGHLESSGIPFVIIFTVFSFAKIAYMLAWAGTTRSYVNDTIHITLILSGLFIIGLTCFELGYLGRTEDLVKRAFSKAEQMYNQKIEDDKRMREQQPFWERIDFLPMSSFDIPGAFATFICLCNFFVPFCIQKAESQACEAQAKTNSAIKTDLPWTSAFTLPSRASWSAIIACAMAAMGTSGAGMVLGVISASLLVYIVLNNHITSLFSRVADQNIRVATKGEVHSNIIMQELPLKVEVVTGMSVVVLSIVCILVGRPSLSMTLFCGILVAGVLMDRYLGFEMPRYFKTTSLVTYAIVVTRVHQPLYGWTPTLLHLAGNLYETNLRSFVNLKDYNIGLEWKSRLGQLVKSQFEVYKFKGVNETKRGDFVSRSALKLKDVMNQTGLELRGKVVDEGCGRGSWCQLAAYEGKATAVHGYTAGKRLGQGHETPITFKTKGYAIVIMETNQDIFKNPIPICDTYLNDIGESSPDWAIEEKNTLQVLGRLKDVLEEAKPKQFVVKVLCPYAPAVIEKLAVMKKEHGLDLVRSSYSRNSTAEMYAVPGKKTGDISRKVRGIMVILMNRFTMPLKPFSDEPPKLECGEARLTTVARNIPEKLYARRLETIKEEHRDTWEGPEKGVYSTFIHLGSFASPKVGAGGTALNRLVIEASWPWNESKKTREISMTDVSAEAQQRVFAKKVDTSVGEVPLDLIKINTEIMRWLVDMYQQKGLKPRVCTMAEFAENVRNNASVGGWAEEFSWPDVQTALADPNFHQQVSEERELHLSGDCKRCIYNVMGKKEKRPKGDDGLPKGSRAIWFYPLIGRFLEFEAFGFLNMDHWVSRENLASGVGGTPVHYLGNVIREIGEKNKYLIADDVAGWDTRITREDLLDELLVPTHASDYHGKLMRGVSQLCYQTIMALVPRPSGRTRSGVVVDVVLRGDQRGSGQVVTYAINTITNTKVCLGRKLEAEGVIQDVIDTKDYSRVRTYLEIHGDAMLASMAVSGDDCVVGDNTGRYASSLRYMKKTGKIRKDIPLWSPSVEHTDWTRVEFCSNHFHPLELKTGQTIVVPCRDPHELIGRARVQKGADVGIVESAVGAKAYANHWLLYYFHRRDLRLLAFIDGTLAMDYGCTYSASRKQMECGQGLMLYRDSQGSYTARVRDFDNYLEAVLKDGPRNLCLVCTRGIECKALNSFFGWDIWGQRVFVFNKRTYSVNASALDQEVFDDIGHYKIHGEPAIYKVRTQKVVFKPIEDDSIHFVTSGAKEMRCSAAYLVPMKAQGFERSLYGSRLVVKPAYHSLQRCPTDLMMAGVKDGSVMHADETMTITSKANGSRNVFGYCVVNEARSCHWPLDRVVGPLTPNDLVVPRACGGPPVEANSLPGWPTSRVWSWDKPRYTIKTVELTNLVLRPSCQPGSEMVSYKPGDEYCCADCSNPVLLYINDQGGFLHEKVRSLAPSLDEEYDPVEGENERPGRTGFWAGEDAIEEEQRTFKPEYTSYANAVDAVFRDAGPQVLSNVLLLVMVVKTGGPDTKTQILMLLVTLGMPRNLLPCLRYEVGCLITGWLDWLLSWGQCWRLDCYCVCLPAMWLGFMSLKTILMCTCLLLAFFQHSSILSLCSGVATQLIVTGQLVIDYVESFEFKSNFMGLDSESVWRGVMAGDAILTIGAVALFFMGLVGRIEYFAFMTFILGACPMGAATAAPELELKFEGPRRLANPTMVIAAARPEYAIHTVNGRVPNHGLPMAGVLFTAAALFGFGAIASHWSIGLCLAAFVLALNDNRNVHRSDLFAIEGNPSKNIPIYQTFDPRERDGLYRIMSNGLFRSEQVGVGYMEKGVFVTGLHVTKLHPLILGGRRVVYHSMNAFKDVVTYGGVIHMSQGIPSTVNLQALPPQRKLQVGMYEVGHVNTSEGKVIHYISIDFPPGTSGSPMFTPDGKYIGPYGNGLYVSGRYCSIIPENGGDGDDEGFEDPIDPMASPDVDYKSFVPGGKVFVDWHPGAGKTRRVIVEKARLSLKDKLTTLILAPTRVVKSEIVAALHEAKFQVSEKLVSPVAGTIVVICHATWVDSMLRKVAQRDAQWNVIIMDEAHFQDPKSIAARGMMEEFGDKGSQILFLTATPPSQFGNKGSNHPIFDIDLNADQIVDDVNFIDRNREGKTVVFVSSRRQADQLARVFAGRGLRTLSLHSDNFEENYPLVKEHFSLIVTTDIAEMGANFDADTVIDLGLSTKPILDDDSVKLECGEARLTTVARNIPEKLYARRLETIKEEHRDTWEGPEKGVYSTFIHLGSFASPKVGAGGTALNRLVIEASWPWNESKKTREISMTDVSAEAQQRVFAKKVDTSVGDLIKINTEIMRWLVDMYQQKGLKPRVCTMAEFAENVRNNASVGGWAEEFSWPDVQTALADPNFHQQVSEERELHLSGDCKRCIYNVMGKKEKRPKGDDGLPKGSRAIWFYPLIGRFLEFEAFGFLNMDHWYLIADDVAGWDTRITREDLLDELLVPTHASDYHGKLMRGVSQLCYQTIMALVPRPSGRTRSGVVVDVVLRGDQRGSGQVVTYAINTITNTKVCLGRKLEAEGVIQDVIDTKDYSRVRTYLEIHGDAMLASMAVSGDDCVVGDNTGRYASSLRYMKKTGKIRKDIPLWSPSVEHTDWTRVEFCSNHFHPLELKTGQTIVVPCRDPHELIGRARVQKGADVGIVESAVGAKAYANHWLLYYFHRRDLRLLAFIDGTLAMDYGCTYSASRKQMECGQGLMLYRDSQGSYTARVRDFDNYLEAVLKDGPRNLCLVCTRGIECKALNSFFGWDIWGQRVFVFNKRTYSVNASALDQEVFDDIGHYKIHGEPAIYKVRTQKVVFKPIEDDSIHFVTSGAKEMRCSAAYLVPMKAQGFERSLYGSRLVVKPAYHSLQRCPTDLMMAGVKDGSVMHADETMTITSKANGSRNVFGYCVVNEARSCHWPLDRVVGPLTPNDLVVPRACGGPPVEANSLPGWPTSRVWSWDKPRYTIKTVELTNLVLRPSCQPGSEMVSYKPGDEYCCADCSNPVLLYINDQGGFLHEKVRSLAPSLDEEYDPVEGENERPGRTGFWAGEDAIEEEQRTFKPEYTSYANAVDAVFRDAGPQVLSNVLLLVMVVKTGGPDTKTQILMLLVTLGMPRNLLPCLRYEVGCLITGWLDWLLSWGQCWRLDCYCVCLPAMWLGFMSLKTILMCTCLLLAFFQHSSILSLCSGVATQLIVTGQLVIDYVESFEFKSNFMGLDSESVWRGVMAGDAILTIGAVALFFMGLVGRIEYFAFMTFILGACPMGAATAAPELELKFEGPRRLANPTMVIAAARPEYAIHTVNGRVPNHGLPMAGVLFTAAALFGFGAIASHWSIGLCLAAFVLALNDNRNVHRSDLFAIEGNPSKNIPIYQTFDPRERDGLYRIMSNGLFRSEQVGVGYMEKGVFVTGLHVTKLHPLILGGRRVVYHSMNAFKDVVTYGGVIHMSQGIPSTVNLQALPPQRKLQVGMYEVGHVNTSEGKVIHYISIDFPPGTSGSPMFTPDGKYIGPYGNGLYVSGRYCSIIPENGGDGDDEGFEDPIDPMASPDVDYKSFVPGGKVFVDWHPGAGKTRRVIVEKARLSLKDKLSTLILAPTRVVKSEIVAALHEAKFQVSEKLVSPVAGTIVVICHATWVDSMLRKVAQRDAQWNVIIMDEAHFQDPKSIAARGMMEEFRDKGSQILFLTATPPSQFGNKGSNHPIFDIDLNADQIVDDVNFIDRNREGKTVVFVSSRRQADQLARVFAGRGLRTLSLHSDNFEENYPLVKEHFSLIVTTDIAEMGANFDADTVIDLGLSTKPILDDDSVNLVTQGIVESSRIQRRGRVGRSRPGKCIAVHHDRNETIQEVCWTEARMLLDVLRGNMMPEEVDKLALMPGHFSMGAEQEKHFRQAVTTYSSPLTIWLSYYIIRSGSNVNTPQDWLFGGDRSSGLFAAVDGQVEREVKPIKYDERVFGSGGFDSLKDYLTSVTKGGLAIRRGDNYRSGGGWLNHQLSADDILAWAFSAYVIITGHLECMYYYWHNDGYLDREMWQRGRWYMFWYAVQEVLFPGKQWMDFITPAELYGMWGVYAASGIPFVIIFTVFSFAKIAYMLAWAGTTRSYVNDTIHITLILSGLFIIGLTCFELGYLGRTEDLVKRAFSKAEQMYNQKIEDDKRMREQQPFWERIDFLPMSSFDIPGAFATFICLCNFFVPFCIQKAESQACEAQAKTNSAIKTDLPWTSAFTLPSRASWSAIIACAMAAMGTSGAGMVLGVISASLLVYIVLNNHITSLFSRVADQNIRVATKGEVHSNIIMQELPLKVEVVTGMSVVVLSIVCILVGRPSLSMTLFCGILVAGVLMDRYLGFEMPRYFKTTSLVTYAIVVTRVHQPLYGWTPTLLHLAGNLYETNLRSFVNLKDYNIGLEWKSRLGQLVKSQFEVYKFKGVNETKRGDFVSRSALKLKDVMNQTGLELRGKVVDEGCGRGSWCQLAAYEGKATAVHGYTAGKRLGQGHETPITFKTKGYAIVIMETNQDIFKNPIPICDTYLNDIGESSPDWAIEEKNTLQVLGRLKDVLEEAKPKQFVVKVLCPYAPAVIEKLAVMKKEHGLDLVRSSYSRNSTAEMYAVPGKKTGDISRKVRGIMVILMNRFTMPLKPFSDEPPKLECGEARLTTVARNIPEKLYARRLETIKEEHRDTWEGPEKGVYSTFIHLGSFASPKVGAGGTALNRLVIEASWPWNESKKTREISMTDVSAEAQQRVFAKKVDTSVGEVPLDLIKINTEIMRWLVDMYQQKGLKPRVCTMAEFAENVRNNASVGGWAEEFSWPDVQTALADPNFHQQVSEERELHLSGDCKRCIYNVMGKKEKRPKGDDGLPKGSRAIWFYPLIGRFLEFEAFGFLNMDHW